MVMVTATGAPAVADPWGTNTPDNYTPDTGSHPDGPPHGYCYGASIGSGSSLKDNMFEAEWSALDPTDATVTL